LIRDVLSPIILAAILAYLLTPIVNTGERYSIPRWVSIAFIYIVIAAFAIIGFIFLLPLLGQQIEEIQSQIGPFWSRAQVFGFNILDRISRWWPPLGKIISEELSGDALTTVPHQWLARTVENAPEFLSGAVSNVVGIATYLITVPFIAFFLVRDSRRFQRAFVEFVPNRYFETTVHVLDRIDDSVGRYIRGILLEALLLGIIATVGLLIIGLKGAILIGMLTGVLNLIPYLGSIVGFVVGIFVALATGGNIFAVTVVFAVAQFVDNWLIQPIVISRSVNLHPLLIFLAVVFGGTYGGFLGMMLAVPLAGAIVVTGRTIREGLRPHVYPYDVVVR
jgi:predicted PurR-regulated permease PerM